MVVGYVDVRLETNSNLIVYYKVKSATSGFHKMGNPRTPIRREHSTKHTMLPYHRVLFVFVTLFIANEADSNDTTININAALATKFATPCKTPNGDNGFCIDINECQVLAKYKDAKSRQDFIDESDCTPGNANPLINKVCCGRYSDYIVRGETEAASDVIEAPPQLLDADPFPQECGKQPMIFPNRIFGGSEAVLGEFPWMVRLRHKAPNGLRSYGCVGFLIAAKYVLTAAHCVKSSMLAPLGPINQVQLGEHNTHENIDCEKHGEKVVCADPPQLIRTGKPIVHPEYLNTSRSQYHDIAIIPLKQPANFTQYVQPICLANQTSSESEMWLAGWGKTEDSDRNPIKLKVAVKRASHDYCKAKYTAAGVEIISAQLCAGGEEGKDSCSGDSGGPLMVQTGSSPWYAEGIVSFGLGCGLEYWPGVYTSIPHYHNWIQKTIKRHWKHNLENSKDCTTTGDNKCDNRKTKKRRRRAIRLREIN